MPDKVTLALRARITGRVQGVWFRGWTEQEANKLGLYGWVRNRDDGSVEALFCGDETIVNEMITRCHSGPQGAEVKEVETFPALGLTPPKFTVKPTV